MLQQCLTGWPNEISKRASFVPSRRLSVKFADDVGQSEGAVDLGGPTQEFRL